MEDYSNDISASDEHDANYSLGDPSTDESTLGYRPHLTQEDTNFYAAILLCKQPLEMERIQGSCNQESKPLSSRISGTLPSLTFIRYLTVLVGFWKASAPEADLDHNLLITTLNDIRVARSNKQSAVGTNNSPASAKEIFSRSLQSSDTAEEYSKYTQQGGDKSRLEKTRKRVLSEVRKTTSKLRPLLIHEIQSANWNSIQWSSLILMVKRK